MNIHIDHRFLAAGFAAGVAAYFLGRSHSAQQEAINRGLLRDDAIVLIDFDQQQRASADHIETLISDITRKLIATGDAANVSRIRVFAVGNRHSFQNEDVLIRLRNMAVTCIVVPSHKKEEADRHLERIPASVLPLQQHYAHGEAVNMKKVAFVIVSDDQDFVPMVKHLVATGSRAYWQTSHAESTSAFRNIARFATEVWRRPSPPSVDKIQSKL